MEKDIKGFRDYKRSGERVESEGTTVTTMYCIHHCRNLLFHLDEKSLIRAVFFFLLLQFTNVSFD